MENNTWTDKDVKNYAKNLTPQTGKEFLADARKQKASKERIELLRKLYFALKRRAVLAKNKSKAYYKKHKEKLKQNKEARDRRTGSGEEREYHKSPKYQKALAEMNRNKKNKKNK
jgi:hypothetical protein